MKKVICSVLAVLSLVTFSLCGCIFNNSGPYQFSDPWNYKQEESGFYYYLVAEDGSIARKGHSAVSATILGLVDEEKVIDELVIPEKLGGYRITRIGTQAGGHHGNANSYGINATNVKKIVINHNVLIPYIGINSNTRRSIFNFDGLVIVNTNIFNMYDYGFFLTNNVQINVEFDTSILINEFKREDRRYVIYDSYGGVQSTYASISKNSEVIYEPEPPTKKGYTFEGWFTEDYQKQWDFEKDIINENMTLYAKWKEI